MGDNYAHSNSKITYTPRESSRSRSSAHLSNAKRPRLDQEYPNPLEAESGSNYGFQSVEELRTPPHQIGSWNPQPTESTSRVCEKQKTGTGGKKNESQDPRERKPHSDARVPYENISDPVRQHFHDTYFKMEAGHKWKLSTGTIVEDAIWTHFKDMSELNLSNSLAASWIVDINSRSIQDAFTQDEVIEMRESVASLPSVPAWEQTLDEFNVHDFDELEDLFERHRKREHPFQSDKMGKHERNWVKTALTQWTSLCETQAFPSYPTEAFYQINLWHYVFDNVMRLIPGMALNR